MSNFSLFCAAAAVLFSSVLVRAEEGGQQCQLNLSPSRSVLPVDRKSELCLKVGVTGFEMASDEKRPELNIALVIDKSGSMSGDRIRQAKEAAACAVNQMNENDIVSIVVYDSDVSVLVPATKLTDKKSVLEKIDSINADGTTALYAGTEKGAEEVKKFFDKGRVNRVILLSDGMANVGPSEPSDLKRLGQKVGGDGITVTTLGLGEGYNEDLMQQLAQAADGNHAFITSEKNLVEVFDEEFKTVTKVVASEASCKVTFADGIRPIRVMNRDAKIEGQEVSFSWNQIYSGHERYVLLEVEVPAGSDGEKRPLASATLSYANMKTNKTDNLSASVEIGYSNSEDAVKASENEAVMKDYASQSVALARDEAIRLRDKGDVKGAKKVLFGAVGAARSAGLEDMAADVDIEAAEVGDDAAWNNNRKSIRAKSNSLQNQQMSAPVK
ncbi:MAG: VWA domain-containing protein [Thermoguttaceae bacterium]|nr:VWA domain-containing protein [Thermoguttaceae bacterium]